MNIIFFWEGAIAIAGKELEAGLVSQRLPTFTFCRNIMLHEFFRHVVLSKRFVEQLRLVSHGGAGRNPVLNKADFLRLKVWLPAIEGQHRIAAVLNTCDDELRHLRDALTALKQQKKASCKSCSPARRACQLKENPMIEPDPLRAAGEAVSGATPSSSEPTSRKSPSSKEDFEILKLRQDLWAEKAKLIFTALSVIAVLLGLGLDRYAAQEQRQYEFAVKKKDARYARMVEISRRADDLFGRTKAVLIRSNQQGVYLPIALEVLQGKLKELPRMDFIAFRLSKDDVRNAVRRVFPVADQERILQALSAHEKELETGEHGLDFKFAGIRNLVASLGDTPAYREAALRLDEELESDSRESRREFEKYFSELSSVLAEFVKNADEIKEFTAWRDGAELQEEWKSVESQLTPDFEIHFGACLLQKWGPIADSAWELINDAKSKGDPDGEPYKNFEALVNDFQRVIYKTLSDFQAFSVESIDTFNPDGQLRNESAVK